MVARGPSDGYTLLVAGLPISINASLYTNLNFNVIRDIMPVAGILRVPNVIMVNPFPAKTLPEFIANAKANPGIINMATAGIGSTLHIFGELFKMVVGVDLVTVHYHGGGAALTDLLGGRVQVIFDPLGEAIGYIRAGRLRALAVTSATRAAAVPDIPTVAEFVPGYEADGWSGMAAPKNTPVAIIDKLISTPLVGSPADFGKLIADETEKWAKVIKFANIKAE
jgi:tripartite-type tricarboxylate transporter receptor subunit TctC